MTDAAKVQVLKRRLAAGEWLRPGDVALVLGVGRSSVVRWLNADPPIIRYKTKPGPGRHRLCDPGDVLRLLAESGNVEAPTSEE